MTIEVRQLVISSTVSGEAESGSRREYPGEPAWLKDLKEELKEDLLRDCKAWFMEKLRDDRER